MMDLDAVEARLATRYGEVVTMKADDVLALVAELRVAQDRLHHVRDLPMALHNDCATCDAIFGGFHP